jgi:hypothetical protein
MEDRVDGLKHRSGSRGRIRYCRRPPLEHPSSVHVCSNKAREPHDIGLQMSRDQCSDGLLEISRLNMQKSSY